MNFDPCVQQPAGRGPAAPGSVLGHDCGLGPLETNMDSHTLELLEFDKIRALVAARAACSLGKSAALSMEPSLDQGEIHSRQALTSEMAEALASGLTPPLGGLHDIRHHVRRCEIGGVLEPEALAETVETLRAIGNLDRWLASSGDQFPRLGGLRQGVGEFSGIVSSIEGCLDNRGTVLDTASRRLSALRREIGRVKDRIQQTLQQMLRSPEIKRILRFPNYSTVGHHYVLPVAKDKRGEIQGSVLRTSSSNETVYIEPAAVGEQSAQLSFLRARESKEVRRILRWLSALVGQVSRSLQETLVIMTELDLIFAREIESRLPDVGTAVQSGSETCPSRARHPLLEAFFRGEASVARPAPGRNPAARRCGRRCRLAGSGAGSWDRVSRFFRSRPRLGQSAPRLGANRRSDRPQSRSSLSNPGRDRAKYGRQDSGAQDGGPARHHGPVGFARSCRRGFAVSDL